MDQVASIVELLQFFDFPLLLFATSWSVPRLLLSRTEQRVNDKLQHQNA